MEGQPFWAIPGRESKTEPYILQLLPRMAPEGRGCLHFAVKLLRRLTVAPLLAMPLADSIGLKEQMFDSE